MAGKIKTKKKQSYKKTKAKSKTPFKQLSMVNLGRLFPSKAMMTHRYFESVNLSPASGVLGKYRFIANSLFDPNFTSTGHQPMGFDNCSLIWNHYTVIGSKIKITFLPVANSPSFAYGIYTDDDSTNNATVYTEIAEQSASVTRYSAAGNTEPKTITKNWSAKKTFGGNVLSNINLQGTTSSSPLDSTVFIVYAQATDGTTSLTTQLAIEIEYIAVWSELKDIIQS